jgi:hypothetical protein
VYNKLAEQNLHNDEIRFHGDLFKPERWNHDEEEQNGGQTFSDPLGIDDTAQMDFHDAYLKSELEETQYAVKRKLNGSVYIDNNKPYQERSMYFSEPLYFPDPMKRSVHDHPQHRDKQIAELGTGQLKHAFRGEPDYTTVYF